MKYFRLLLKKEDEKVVFSNITEEEADDSTFEGMNWEKPVIIFNDGAHVHFISLEKNYLECVTLGISASNDLK